MQEGARRQADKESTLEGGAWNRERGIKGHRVRDEGQGEGD